MTKLEKVREKVASRLKTVNFALDIMSQESNLRPRIEGARDSLHECLKIIADVERSEENED